MISAFGVEHGEVSKAAPKVRVPGSKHRKKPTAAQQRTQGRGGPSGPERIKGAFHRVGSADISIKGVGGAAGKGLGATGRFFEQRPGLTGAALVAGGGAGGYKYLSQKEPRKRSS